MRIKQANIYIDSILPIFSVFDLYTKSTKIPDVEALKPYYQGLIDKYLHPLSKDADEEKRITRDLKELRNNGCFGFFMLNALWVMMQFQFEYVSVAFPRLQIPFGALYNRHDQKVQILGLIFLILFTLVLVLQFISMLFHRWGTIIEILASTRRANITSIVIQS